MWPGVYAGGGRSVDSNGPGPMVHCAIDHQPRSSLESVAKSPRRVQPFCGRTPKLGAMFAYGVDAENPRPANGIARGEALEFVLSVDPGCGYELTAWSFRDAPESPSGGDSHLAIHFVDPATHHIETDASRCHDIRSADVAIEVGGSNILTCVATGKRTIRYLLHGVERTLTLQNVRIVPGFGRSIISESPFLRGGCKIEKDGRMDQMTKCRMKWSRHDVPRFKQGASGVKSHADH